MIIVPNIRLTAHIYYYRPDYTWLIQEFIHQLDDVYPDLPRFHKFLNYWHTEKLAPIEKILYSYAELHKPGYRTNATST